MSLLTKVGKNGDEIKSLVINLQGRTRPQCGSNILVQAAKTMTSRMVPTAALSTRKALYTPVLKRSDPSGASA